MADHLPVPAVGAENKDQASVTILKAEFAPSCQDRGTFRWDWVRKNCV